MIIDRLMDRIRELKNPTVVGLDPKMEYMPDDILKNVYGNYGHTLIAVKYALLAYNKGIIDAICDIVPAVKPQVAFYEQFGSEGLDAYVQTVAYAKKKGMVVIGDVKRSDIAATATAYSNVYLGQVDVFGKKMTIIDTDFITVNPFLGEDSIEPFLNNCRDFDRGLFVLVKTSNKGSGCFQNLIVEGGRPLYEVCGGYVEKWGEGFIGRHGYSSIGAVVGATHPKEAARLREIMPKTFFLVPGYGAQGGKASDVAAAFDSNGQGAIINSSSGIIAAHKANEYIGMAYDKAARAAAIAMKEDLQQVL